MFDSVRFWKQVDAKKAEIKDEWPYIVGVDDPSRGLCVGCPVQVDRETAAKTIVEGAGRLATQAEIEAEHERTAAVMAKFKQTEQERAVRNLLFPQAQAAAAQPKK